MSNGSTLKPIATRPAPLAEMVQEAIRDAIVTRRLSPGERITEAALAQQLGVSKTPVREALLKLEYIGLIESDGARGGRIITPSPETIRSAYEVRMGLETEASRLVAGRPGGGDAVRESADLSLTAAQSGDRAGFREHDRQFHRLLAQTTGNLLLARLIYDSFDLTWTLRDRDVPDTDDFVLCARQHLDVVAAIDAKDPEKADQTMRVHIETVLDMVLAGYEAQERAGQVGPLR